MAKPSPRKPQTAQPKTALRQTPKAAAVAAQSTPTFELPEWMANTRLQGALIFAFAFLLYANTLGHGFVQDDAIVITDNMYTQQGVNGIPGILSKDTFFGFFKVEGKDQLVSGGRYRPLTLVLFAFIYQLAGANPFAFHLLTVLLFAATCWLLYQTLLLLLSPRGGAYAGWTAWAASVLFAAHPIHTEVVANIKGCDEIATLLGSLGALYLCVKAFDTGKAQWSYLAALAFFAACLSKENAVTFVVVIPLALWFFRSASAGQLIKSVSPVWIAFILFFIMRGAILHWKFGAAPMEMMNNPFVKLQGSTIVPFTAGERLATIVYTLGKYIWLLVVPHPLTHDYYPRHIGIMNFAKPGVWVGLLAYAGLLWYALKGIQQRDAVRFGILFFVLTLSIVSNIVFPIGTNMGERFAFMPSVGFCLAAAALLAGWAGKSGQIRAALIVVGAASALFALKTLTRNPVWESNEKLFVTDVKTSGESAKIRNAMGGTLFDKARVETDSLKKRQFCIEGVQHLNKAIQINPVYNDAFISRGGCHFLLGEYDRAIEDYRTAARLYGSADKTASSLALALREGAMQYGQNKKDYTTAIQYLNESWSINPKDPATARLLGVAYSFKGDFAGALQWFQKAVDLLPNDAGYLFDLGTAYFYVGDKAKADEYHQKAAALDPKMKARLQ